MKQILILIAILFPFNINDDVNLSQNNKSSITNTKLQDQLKSEDGLIKELKWIQRDSSLKNDTLILSLKLTGESLSKNKENSGIDLYSLLGALLGAAISGGAAIFVFYLG